MSHTCHFSCHTAPHLIFSDQIQGHPATAILQATRLKAKRLKVVHVHVRVQYVQHSSHMSPTQVLAAHLFTYFGREKPTELIAMPCVTGARQAAGLCLSPSGPGPVPAAFSFCGQVSSFGWLCWSLFSHVVLLFTFRVCSPLLFHRLS